MTSLRTIPRYGLRRRATRTVARVAERVARPPSDLDPAVGPDYVGVGAQRSGTSRWHELICAHPDAGPPRGRFRREAKELHWFDSGAAENRDRYRSRFPRDRGVVGEWTPRYLHDRRPIDVLSAWFPDLRYLVLLRDPLDRLDSAVRFARGRGETVDDAMLADAIERGSYLVQLQHLWSRVAHERVLLLQFEQCNADPGRELKRTYEFLGLDADFVPEGLHRVVNAAAAGGPPAMSPSLRERARARFDSEREDLAACCPELDLGLWS